MLTTSDIHSIKIVAGIFYDLFVNWDFVITMSNCQVFGMTIAVFLWKHRIEHYYTLVFKDTIKGKDHAILYISIALVLSVIPFIGLLVLVEVILDYGFYFDEHIDTVID